MNKQYTIYNERNYKIDMLRALGTLSVILAHTSIPSLFSHIRTFDVVMLVWISGWTFAMTYQKKTPYKLYITKRFKKLIIPVWLLITFVFVVSYLACTLLQKNQLYSVKQIFLSYIFDNGGMGYIWIAKVYFLIALISYALYALNKKVSNDFYFLIFITVSLLLYQALVLFDSFASLYLVREYFSYLIPYGIVALLGIRCFTNQSFLKKLTIYSSVIFISCQIILIYVDKMFSPGNYKYPPQLYYLFYGLSIAILVYYLLPNKKIGIISWISINSFSIYLFHIISLLAYNMLVEIVDISLLTKWYIEYPIIVITSGFATMFWNKLKTYQRKTK